MLIRPRPETEPVALELVDASEGIGVSLATDERVRRARRIRAVLTRPSGALGAAIVAIAVLMAVVSVVWTPYPTWQPNLGFPEEGFSSAHLLGVDSSGRDELSRLMAGARVSLEIGVVTLAAVLVIGVLHGVLAGYFGGVVDQVLMAVLNFVYAIPAILITIVAGILLGRSVATLSLAIALSHWMPMALVVRAQTLTLREREYVLAAKMGGTPTWRIVWSHILPNTTGPIIVLCTYIVPQAILTEAFLSFLGLGVPPPTPSWGGMAADGYRDLQLAPHVALIPSVTLCTVLLGFYLVGDATRDAFDPRRASWAGRLGSG